MAFYTNTLSIEKHCLSNIIPHTPLIKNHKKTIKWETEACNSWDTISYFIVHELAGEKKDYQFLSPFLPYHPCATSHIFLCRTVEQTYTKVLRTFIHSFVHPWSALLSTCQVSCTVSDANRREKVPVRIELTFQCN